MRRRRFLALSAAFATMGASAAPIRWQGRALGAEVSLTLRAPEAQARAAIGDIAALLETVEAEFSLYRPSSLTKLNRTGRLRPSPMFRDLMKKADTAHRLTDGLFDPTVQPLWDAQAKGHPLPRHLVGWDRVEQGRSILLGHGQALTFNGIAQGYATDLARDRLHALGLMNILVNIGEYAGSGGPWRIGIEDPAHGPIATTTLINGAIATSSAAPFGVPHIFGPTAPRYATVSIQADQAWRADALSTAAILADAPSFSACALPKVSTVSPR